MKFDNWCNVGEPKHGYTPLMCWMRYRPDEMPPQELLTYSDIRLQSLSGYTAAMLFIMYTHKSTSTVPKSLQYTMDRYNKIPNWR